MIEWELLSIKIILVKVTLQIGEKKYLLLVLFWQLILGLAKTITNLNREKNNRKLLWKRIFAKYIINELLSRTWQSY